MPIISFLLLFILFSAENSRASDPEGKFDAGVLFNVAPPPRNAGVTVILAIG